MSASIPQPEEQPAGKIFFDVTRGTDGYVDPSEAAQLLMVVTMVKPESAKPPFTWHPARVALGLLSAQSDVRKYSYADYLSLAESGNYLRKPLPREQVASLTPEVYAYLRRTFKATTSWNMSKGLGQKLADAAARYAKDASVPLRVYSRAQLDALGIGYKKSGDDYQRPSVQYAYRVKWFTRAQYPDDKPGVTTRSAIEPAVFSPAPIRLAGPGPQEAAIGWGRVGGSDDLNGWRADGHVVTDVEPVSGGQVRITATVRGVGLARQGDTGPWARSGKYTARGTLKLLARGTDGNFNVVVRREAEGSVTAGAEVAEPCSLTYTLARADLVNHALDWGFGADEAAAGGFAARAHDSGRLVLFLPASMDGYKPGTVRDPASGERTGRRSGADTPLNHSLSGHAQVTTTAAQDGTGTIVTADVHIGSQGLPGRFDVDVVNTLERYDAGTDTWRSVGSTSTRKNTGDSVDADTLTATVPTAELNLYRLKWGGRDTFPNGSEIYGTIYPLWNATT
ncbi:hypothetical protein ACSNOK_29640 [Streptomyces sp. URMC 126]|uniref:hypothetical protein n=1 Tax=Streptomyces sp. URMC 126 TaxID=3423401 RepID=UPI003F1DDDE5